MGTCFLSSKTFMIPMDLLGFREGKLLFLGLLWVEMK